MKYSMNSPGPVKNNRLFCTDRGGFFCLRLIQQPDAGGSTLLRDGSAQNNLFRPTEGSDELPPGLQKKD